MSEQITQKRWKIDKKGCSKTTGIIPYSSVFFTLDCGYWSAEAEDALRKKMENAE